MTTATQALPKCEQPIIRHGQRRSCSQSVALVHWFDTAGREHYACARHVREMQSRWTPEAPLNDWERHTHFDDRDANLADCPACERLVEEYAGWAPEPA